VSDLFRDDLAVAQLGGAAPGLDFIAADYSHGTAIPMVRDDPANPLQYRPQPAVAYPDPGCALGYDFSTGRAHDVDGDGRGDPEALCGDGGYVAFARQSARVLPV